MLKTFLRSCESISEAVFTRLSPFSQECQNLSALGMNRHARPPALFPVWLMLCESVCVRLFVCEAVCKWL